MFNISNSYLKYVHTTETRELVCYWKTAQCQAENIYESKEERPGGGRWRLLSRAVAGLLEMHE